MLMQVTTEEQRDSFSQALADAEDWLYSDGEAEPAAVFRWAVGSNSISTVSLTRRYERAAWHVLDDVRLPL